jgi:Protein of unknown function (DUF3352)
MLSAIRALVLAIGAAAALAISGCDGGGGGVSADDPASLAPANAPIYVQATVQPTGKLKSDVESLASTVSGLPDPTAKLISELDRSAKDEDLNDPNFSVEDDVEPWLGKQAGVFAEGYSEDPGAAIVQTTDPGAAAKAARDGAKKGSPEKTYDGVDYVLDDDTAAGVVDDFFVLGDEQAFKDVVDVSKGEDALGDQSDFTDTIDGAPSGSIADVYLDLGAAGDEIRTQDPDNAKAVEASVGDLSGKSVLASLIPSSDSLELDATTNLEQDFISSDLQDLIASFPADSFAAVGIPDLGAQIERTIDQLEKAGVPGANRDAIDEQLAQSGLSLDDLSSALGDLGVFAAGTDQASLQGAGVITGGDSEAVQKLIKQLSSLVLLSGASGASEAPIGTGFEIRDPTEIGRQPLIVTTEDGKIGIGYGEQATEQALKGGGSTLADDPTFKEAVGKLGDTGVSGYVALAKVFQLADSLGSLQDPGYRQARPYLQRLSYLIFGSGEQGNQSSKVIVGVSK